jgi:hypothetical protein
MACWWTGQFSPERWTKDKLNKVSPSLHNPAYVRKEIDKYLHEEDQEAFLDFWLPQKQVLRPC